MSASGWFYYKNLISQSPTNGSQSSRRHEVQPNRKTNAHSNTVRDVTTLTPPVMLR